MQPLAIRWSAVAAVLIFLSVIVERRKNEVADISGATTPHRTDQPRQSPAGPGGGPGMRERCGVPRNKL